jgi:hypothetical protein
MNIDDSTATAQLLRENGELRKLLIEARRYLSGLPADIGLRARIDVALAQSANGGEKP